MRGVERVHSPPREFKPTPGILKLFYAVHTSMRLFCSKQPKKGHFENHWCGTRYMTSSKLGERSGKGGPDPRNRSDEEGTQTKTTFPVRDCVPRGLGCVAQKENAGWFVTRGRSLGGSVRSEGANVREMRLAQAGKVGIEQCTLPSSDWAVAWGNTARFVLAHKSVAWERGRSAVA